MQRGKSGKKGARKPKAQARHKAGARKGRAQSASRPQAGETAKPAEKSHLAALHFLEKSWPRRITAQVSAAFSFLKKALAETAQIGEAPREEVTESTWPPLDLGVHYFDPLEIIKHVLMAQDLLFLSRQVSYHIAAEADVPKAWGDADQVQYVFSRIVEHMVKRAARGSRLTILLKPFSIRGVPGVEVSFSGIDRHLEDDGREMFLTDMFQDRADTVSGISLAECRQIAVRQRGQLWADLPKPNAPTYHLLLPATEQAAMASSPEGHTFKYDISISNYADVRRRFGSRKSQSLVNQIEQYVRSLVRYPIDTVVAISDKGIITAIYETAPGGAQSVASRISQRLGKEAFRIGRRPVDLSFSYRLSSLSEKARSGSKDNSMGNS